MAPRTFALFGPLALTACAGWPTPTNLPDLGELVVAGVEPEVSWRDTLVAPTEQPPGNSTSLSVSEGVRITETLTGLGWFDEGVPAPLGSTDCGSLGARTPVSPGDWIGDVHVYGLTAAAPGRLCARLDAGDTTTGLDLVLLRLDDCGVPTGPVTDGDEPLGYGGVGPVHSWSTELETQSTLALVVAGYSPNDLERSVGYTLSVALAPSSSALCPDLAPPEEGP